MKSVEIDPESLLPGVIEDVGSVARVWALPSRFRVYVVPEVHAYFLVQRQLMLRNSVVCPRRGTVEVGRRYAREPAQWECGGGACARG